MHHKTHTKRHEPAPAFGCLYSPTQTVFRVYSPQADSVTIELEPPSNCKTERHALTKADDGAHHLTIAGDLERTRYRYHARFGNKIIVTIDPYGIASTANATQSVVVDPHAFWPMRHPRPAFSGMLSDAVIYEASVRDMTSQPALAAQHPRTYLGAAEKGLKTPAGRAAGFDHIASLGVTHIQFLPLNDFWGIDEKKPLKRYNWGYNPVQYFVPEGSYSTDPDDPYARINELRAMIDRYHQVGLRVVVDGVFNHVYDAKAFSFACLNPGIAFRKTKDGRLSVSSGCANDLASEHPLIRQLIVDAVRHWVKTFKIDGFRLDLMGLLDIETVHAIQRVLDDEGDGLVLYGEGWLHDTPLDTHLSHMYNADRLHDTAFFNDRFRDNIKGSTFAMSDRGFALGGTRDIYGLRQAIGGHLKPASLFSTPGQSINYVSCHDNHTLHDKIKRAAPKAASGIRKRYQMLSSALVLLSQGVPFLHMGQEFLRTKNGDGNSYKSSDDINGIDWSLADVHADLVEAIKMLVRLRKTQDVFRLRTAEDIVQRLEASLSENGSLIIAIDDVGARWHVVFKSQAPAETLTFAAAFDIVYCNGTCKKTAQTLNIEGIAVAVLRSPPEEAHENGNILCQS